MWFICDVSGILCMTVAYCLLLSANVVVFRIGWWPWGDLGSKLCLGLYETWFILGIWAHLSCMLTDPGAVPLEQDAEEGAKQCSQCRAPKPPRAHHCSICRRCIMKMDHHCPWVNNCVGARNQKHFLLFLVYVHLQCCAALASLGSRFLEVTTPRPAPMRREAFLGRGPRADEEWRAEVAQRQQFDAKALSDGEVLSCVLVFFVAIIFGLFTIIMICDQVSNILSNTTGIEHLQGHTPKARQWRESLQEVLGRGPSWRWLVPTPLKSLQVGHEM